MSDPAERFSSRVEDYARYRPSYPPAIVALLQAHCGLMPSSVVADVGSGTGLLAELFLKLGCFVFGVEPNIRMRIAGEHRMRGFSNFRSVQGRAESTTLRDSSVDLITAGQAFHWFDPIRARSEFRRILKPSGWVAMVWNERLVTGDPFLGAYETLLKKYAPEYEKVDRRRIDAGAMGMFFEHRHWHTAIYPNEQIFDLKGLVGRLQSSSYAPLPGSPAYDPMMRELEQLFDGTQQDGAVRLLYHTKVYYGRLAAHAVAT